MKKIENVRLQRTQKRFYEMFISVNSYMYVCIELWCNTCFLLWNVALKSLKIIHFEKYSFLHDILSLNSYSFIHSTHLTTPRVIR